MTSLASFADCVDLATSSLGGVALACSDDFFASMDRLLDPAEAVFDPDAFTDRGKLMDGWESRRKRTEGNDWLILRLGVPGTVRGFDVDTSHFLGNQPPFCTLDGCVAPADATAEQLQSAPWTEILPQVPLQPGTHNLFAAAVVARWTHLRLNILPDGGVARLRVFGLPSPAVDPTAVLDVAALSNGGRAVAASDMFFGDMNNLLLPERAPNMGGGWETRRRRDTGHDWVVVRLAGRATLASITADTHHFKGNFPHRISLEGLDDAAAGPYRIERRDWTPIVAPTLGAADHAHTWSDLLAAGPFTHVRMCVYPCGGVSRLRILGTLEAPRTLAGVLNELPEDEAHATLLRCCGSSAWATRVLDARPFADDTAARLGADEAWWAVSDDDQREAFAHHPRIGEDPERLRAKFASTSAWAGNEQAGVAAASEETLVALQQANVEYEARFGHVFLICATGLTADQMLGALRRRLPHDPAREHLVAAGEQAKITRLRLDKLV